VGITLYVIIPTVIPIGPADDPNVIQWAAEHPAAERIVAATGMHQPYTAPWFIAAAALLTASTAVCALERTRLSLKQWRRAGVVSDGLARRLREEPTLSIPVPASGPATPDAVLDAAARGLAASRLRVARGPVVCAAWGNRFGLLGSPVFHWSLVLLFVVAAAGQLTRFEGILGIGVGGLERTDARENYLQAEPGPLFFDRFTETRFKVPKADDDLVIGGIERGWTPWVQVLVGDRVVKEQWIHPNRPLRYGTLLVHRELPEPLLVARLSSGEQTRTEELFFRRGADGKVMPLERGLTTPEARYDLRFEAREGRRIAVTVRMEGAADYSGEQVVGLGEVARLPQGMSFTPVRIGEYAPLRVQNDWSVWWIYAAFVLGSAAAALAVFFPPRMVWAVVDSGPDGLVLNVVTSQRKMDPGFPGMLRRHLATALGAPETEEMEEV